MALAIDASSPAVATGAPTATTASFTPPANAVLLVAAAMDSSGSLPPLPPSVTDNLGTHLVYDRLEWQSHNDVAIVGQAVMWVAVVNVSAAMTVSVTNGVPAFSTAVKVWVITGADTSDPAGTHGKGGATGGVSSIAQSYVAQATSGWSFIAVNDDDATGVMTAGTGCTVDATAAGGGGDYGFARRTTADNSAGGTNTLNVNAGGSSFDLAWVYAEIRPAGTEEVGEQIPQPQLPSWLLFQLVAANQDQWENSPPSTQITVDTGTSSFGVEADNLAVGHIAVRTGSGCAGLLPADTARKVAIVTGTSSLGVVSNASSRKVAPGTGTAPAGLATVVTTSKAAPAVGTGAAGLCATDTSKKVAVTVDRSVVGLSATEVSKKVAVTVDLSPLGFSATDTAKRISISAGVSELGLESYQTGVSPRAETGSAFIGLSSTLAGKRVAEPSGAGSVGLGATDTGKRVALPSGLSALGLGGLLAARRVAVCSARCQLGVVGAFSPADIRSVSGRAYLGLAPYQHQCTTYRSFTGEVTRPSTGTTSRPFTTTTSRPSSGTTIRPSTGITERPCQGS